MDFLLVQKLVDVLSGLDVHLVPNTHEGVEVLIGSLFKDILPSEDAGQAAMRTLQTLEPGTIYLLSSSVDLQYGVFQQEETGQMLLVGPCRASRHSETEAADYLRQHGMPEHRIRGMLAFCRQQPAVSTEKLHGLLQLLGQQLTGREEPLPVKVIDHHWPRERQRALLNMDAFEELEQIRRVETRYAASAALTEAVKQGNLSLAYQFIRKMNQVPDDLMRSYDNLRNNQNLCIILNTQLRHAMEEAGVSPYRLDQLSGGIARQIEKMKSVSAVRGYFAEILRQYCELAQQREQKDLSSLSRLAVSYVRSHLADNLSVKDTARALTVNPDYLSAKFHQEVGIPFTAYVNRERVRMAAALLQKTDLQIQQIASAVGYNNTSYFARQFLRYQGVSPSAYRRGY